MLCVGEFFGENNEKLEAYRNGNLKSTFFLVENVLGILWKQTNWLSVAVPTYILGPINSKQNDLYKDLENGEICANLTYLGRRGLYTSSTGVKIAYVSGIEVADTEPTTEWNFKIDDVKSVTNACLASNHTVGDYRGVDVLITSQWPDGVQENQKNASRLLSWLSAEIKPRYHFCGLNNDYFEPPPFRNIARPNSQFELATRLVALANVGNADKKKWIYALNVVPVDKMRVTDLIQKTTNEIPCPYDSMNLLSRDQQTKTDPTDRNSQFFYDMGSFPGEEGRGRKRGGLGHNDNKQKRPKQPQFDQEKCWFCLSSPTVEKHLVIAVGENFYLALAKGPINPYHILVLSVTHIQSVSLLSEDDWKELDRFKAALRKFFESKGQSVTFFERNYKSGHLQLNAVPVDKELEWKIKHAIDDKADEYNLPFETLPPLTEATQLPDRGPYFMAELPNETTLLCRQMKHFPLHFGREIFCSSEVLDCEDKVDWRQCNLDKDVEIDYVKRFRDEFKPFDFTMNW